MRVIKVMALIFALGIVGEVPANPDKFCDNNYIYAPDEVIGSPVKCPDWPELCVDYGDGANLPNLQRRCQLFI